MASGAGRMKSANPEAAQRGIPTSAVPNLTRTHYSTIDGLRGMAILLVVIYHLCLNHPEMHSSNPGFLLGLAQFGWAGVDLFFVLSGFLITGILLDTKSKPHYLRNFLVRRFLRIWPLYYLALAVFILLPPLLMQTVPDELQRMHDEQAWFWLYSANWLFAREGGFNGVAGGYFWSLAVEEQFYILWPAFVYFLSRKQLMLACIAMFVCTIGFRLVHFSMGATPSAVYVMTHTHLDGLAIGALIAAGLREPGSAAMVQRLAPIAGVIGVIGLLLVRWQAGAFFFSERLVALIGLSFAALAFGYALIRTLSSPAGTLLSRALSSAPMVAMGRYSYALYLVHVPVAVVVAKLMLGESALAARTGLPTAFLLYFLTTFGLSVLLSWLSWHLVEKRLLSFKRYFEYES